ncbi:metallophosphoesterase [Lentilactobacillus sp. Marseille-Q4993]|uniref:metallophosphoesterase n=1 Tax=Lentilactobacillus sp. Marseille-Q4993 TaxID=3039492 RepID=UPI0024BD43A2|nr:metallophosphoesterase [Lentilactobacillus sp. Marseille-Q4993]
MQYFTSDTHFFHDRLLGISEFSPRPFLTVEDMNETIINNWNTRVGENDVVYHLGDIAVLHTRPEKDSLEQIFEVLDSLNGRLVLIKGNHDSRALFKYLEKNNHLVNGKPKFEFHDVGALIKMNHRQYYLTHYPMMMGIVKQIINLHGHIHHYAVPVKENINVGIDTPESDYLKEKPAFGTPFSEAEIEEMVAGKKVDFAKRK